MMPLDSTTHLHTPYLSKEGNVMWTCGKPSHFLEGEREILEEKFKEELKKQNQKLRNRLVID